MKRLLLMMILGFVGYSALGAMEESGKNNGKEAKERFYEKVTIITVDGKEVEFTKKEVDRFLTFKNLVQDVGVENTIPLLDPSATEKNILLLKAMMNQMPQELFIADSDTDWSSLFALGHTKNLLENELKGLETQNTRVEKAVIRGTSDFFNHQETIKQHEQRVRDLYAQLLKATDAAASMNIDLQVAESKVEKFKELEQLNTLSGVAAEKEVERLSQKRAALVLERKRAAREYQRAKRELVRKNRPTVDMQSELRWKAQEHIQQGQLLESKLTKVTEALESKKQELEKNSKSSFVLDDESKKEVTKILERLPKKFLQSLQLILLGNYLGINPGIQHELVEYLKKQDMRESDLEAALAYVSKNKVTIPRIIIDQLIETDMKVINSLGRRSSVSSLGGFCFSGNGKYIVQSYKNALKAWDIENIEKVQIIKSSWESLNRHSQDISSVSFSADSRYVATASRMDGAIGIWMLIEGGWRDPLDLLMVKYIDSYARTLCFSPDNSCLAVLGSDTLSVLDTYSWKAFQTLSCKKSKGDPVFSSDGHYLAAVSENLIKVWDTTTWQCIKTLGNKERSNFSCLAFSPDGKTILAGSSAKSFSIGFELQPIEMYDFSTGRCTKKLYTGYEPANICFSPDGSYCATGGSYRIHIWNASTGEIFKEFPALKYLISEVRFSPNNKYFAAGSSDGIIDIYNVPTLPDFNRLKTTQQRLLFMYYYNNEKKHEAPKYEDLSQSMKRYVTQDDLSIFKKMKSSKKVISDKQTSPLTLGRDEVAFFKKKGNYLLDLCRNDYDHLPLEMQKVFSRPAFTELKNEVFPYKKPIVPELSTGDWFNDLYNRYKKPVLGALGLGVAAAGSYYLWKNYTPKDKALGEK